jgi:hypothetical protein
MILFDRVTPPCSAKGNGPDTPEDGVEIEPTSFTSTVHFDGNTSLAYGWSEIMRPGRTTWRG